MRRMSHLDELDEYEADLERMREHTRSPLDTQTTWGNDELTTRVLTLPAELDESPQAVLTTR